MDKDLLTERPEGPHLELKVIVSDGKEFSYFYKIVPRAWESHEDFAKELSSQFLERALSSLYKTGVYDPAGETIVLYPPWQISKIEVRGNA